MIYKVMLRNSSFVDIVKYRAGDVITVIAAGLFLSKGKIDGEHEDCKAVLI